MKSPSMSEVQKTVEAIANRTWEITEHRLRKMESDKEMKKRADDWAKEANVAGRTLVYQKRSKGGTEYQLLDEPGVDAWSTWTVPMSMREVEPGVGLIMTDDKSHADLEWHAQKKKPRQEDEE